jgi:hypothetical protein
VAIRRRLVLIPLLLSLLAACGVFAGIGVVTARPASAAPVVTVCLTNAPGFCADVKNSVNTSGQPIWLYRPQDGAKDYHWFEVPVPCTVFTCLCDNADCISFEDVQNPTLCLAASPTGSGVQLINCHIADGMGGTARAAWIHIGNNLENFFLATNHDLSVTGPLFSGRYLYVAQHVSPGGNVWQQWSGF